MPRPMSKSLFPGSKKTPGVKCSGVGWPYYCTILETGYQFYWEFLSFIVNSFVKAVTLPLGGGDFVSAFWMSQKMTDQQSALGQSGLRVSETRL